MKLLFKQRKLFLELRNRLTRLFLIGLLPDRFRSGQAFLVALDLERPELLFHRLNLGILLLKGLLILGDRVLPVLKLSQLVVHHLLRLRGSAFVELVLELVDLLLLLDFNLLRQVFEVLDGLVLRLDLLGGIVTVDAIKVGLIELYGLVLLLNQGAVNQQVPVLQPLEPFVLF